MEPNESYINYTLENDQHPSNHELFLDQSSADSIDSVSNAEPNNDCLSTEEDTNDVQAQPETNHNHSPPKAIEMKDIGCLKDKKYLFKTKISGDQGNYVVAIALFFDKDGHLSNTVKRCEKHQATTVDEE